MIQYLTADLWRINRRIPRIVAWVLYLIIGIASTLFTANQNVFNFIKLGNSIVFALSLWTIFLAMTNLYFVFEDDLQTKTLLTAIGQGIKRYQIIFVKWFEMLLLTLFDCISLTTVMWITGLAKGVTLKGSALTKVSVQLAITCLTFGVMTSLIMIIIFHIMHLGLTQLLFCLLVFKPISLILKYLEMNNEILAKLRFSRFLIGNNLDSFHTSLNAGRFSVKYFIVIFIYWAIGMGVTYLLFRKKELDF